MDSNKKYSEQDTTPHVFPRHASCWFGSLFLTLLLLVSPARADHDANVVAVVLGENIEKDSKIKINSRIFSSLLARFAQDNHIHPTEEEIEEFISKTDELQKRIADEQEAELKRISGELENDALSQEQRDKLASQKKSIESILKVKHEIADRTKGMDEEMKKIKRRMAEEFVQRWKVNKALYDKYGGRVIFQQAGPEPLDAYRDFLKEESKKGTFQIFDSKIEEDFWHYFTNDKMHSFIPEDKAKKTFRSPWWTTTQGAPE